MALIYSTSGWWRRVELLLNVVTLARSQSWCVESIVIYDELSVCYHCPPLHLDNGRDSLVCLSDSKKPITVHRTLSSREDVMRNCWHPDCTANKKSRKTTLCHRHYTWPTTEAASCFSHHDAIYKDSYWLFINFLKHFLRHIVKLCNCHCHFIPIYECEGPRTNRKHFIQIKTWINV